MNYKVFNFLFIFGFTLFLIVVSASGYYIEQFNTPTNTPDNFIDKNIFVSEKKNYMNNNIKIFQNKQYMLNYYDPSLNGKSIDYIIYSDKDLLNKYKNIYWNITTKSNYKSYSYVELILGIMYNDFYDTFPISNKLYYLPPDHSLDIITKIHEGGRLISNIVGYTNTWRKITNMEIILRFNNQEPNNNPYIENLKITLEEK